MSAGALDSVLLAVIALVPLAAFELGADLPAAAQTLPATYVAPPRGRSRGAPRRPAWSPNPSHPRPVAVVPGYTPPRCAGAGMPRSLRDGLARWVLDDSLDLDPRLGPERRGRRQQQGRERSTLANVLLRFLPYQGGSVLRSTASRSMRPGRRRVPAGGRCLVSQDAHIFDTTLEENTAPLPGEDATRAAKLLDAAWIGRAAAGVGREELPAGLATRVGARGGDLRRIQRQRLALAWAPARRLPGARGRRAR